MKIKDEKQIEAKKKQILDIAETIITEEGIENLSVRKIAARLNQTPGILYHYFKDKEAVLAAIVERGYQEILAVIRETAKDTDPPEKRLDRLPAAHDTETGYFPAADAEQRYRHTREGQYTLHGNRR